MAKKTTGNVTSNKAAAKDIDFSTSMFVVVKKKSDKKDANPRILHRSYVSRRADQYTIDEAATAKWYKSGAGKGHFQREFRKKK